LVAATRQSSPRAPEFIKRWVSWGASPRGSQNLILGSKARAILHGRFNVSVEDIRALAHPVLRHRIILNFNAEAEGVRTDGVIDKLLETVREA